MKSLPLLCSTALTMALSMPMAVQAQTTPPAKPAKSAAAKAAAPKLTATEHLAKDPQIAAKLQPLLPTGTTVQAAATGFPTLGEFAATLHLSKNLNIPFAQLKAKVTGNKPDTLDVAVHDLKPSVNAAAEVKKAKAEAKVDEGKVKGS
jgi:hypothetical protein